MDDQQQQRVIALSERLIECAENRKAAAHDYVVTGEQNRAAGERFENAKKAEWDAHKALLAELSDSMSLWLPTT